MRSSNTSFDRPAIFTRGFVTEPLLKFKVTGLSDTGRTDASAMAACAGVSGSLAEQRWLLTDVK
jgi:hypothetical protein